MLEVSGLSGSGRCSATTKWGARCTQSATIGGMCTSHWSLTREWKEDERKKEERIR